MGNFVFIREFDIARVMGGQAIFYRTRSGSDCWLKQKEYSLNFHLKARDFFEYLSLFFIKFTLYITNSTVNRLQIAIANCTSDADVPLEYCNAN